MADNLKAHGIPSVISTITTLAAITPVLWFIGKPLLVSQISTAMAAEFEDVIETKQAPVENAFKVLLSTEITKLRKEIASLRFRQRSGEDWTEADAEYLAELEIELEALQEALEEL